jgi:hypothetical protein
VEDGRRGRERERERGREREREGEGEERRYLDRARAEGRRGSSARVATHRRLLGRCGLVGEELPALYVGGEVEGSAIYSLSEPLLAFLRALAATAFASLKIPRAR